MVGKKLFKAMYKNGSIFEWGKHFHWECHIKPFNSYTCRTEEELKKIIDEKEGGGDKCVLDLH